MFKILLNTCEKKLGKRYKQNTQPNINRIIFKFLTLKNIYLQPDFVN